MKKQKKYGVYHFKEWDFSLFLAGRSIRIHFIGGSSSDTGIIPATFITRNEIVQYAIENCIFFKDGRIKLIEEMDIEEPKVESEEAQETSTNNEDVADNFTEVEVGSLEEAVDYLVSNFDDANKQQLRSKKAANAFAETKGIRFVGL